ncbi:MAG: MFS transporter [Bacteroidales bacterium]|nr:MFS transporter [Bacteroidales bacterium]
MDKQINASIPQKETRRNPWLWVPTLYFAEGIPYFIVNTISVLMFTNLGVPNDQNARFTSLLYLPWMLKCLWGPFVDIVKTKRWWILTMQILMSAAFILLAVTMPRPDAATIADKSTSISLFYTTLIIFLVTAFASATHDIAADGFYMLALPQNQQSAFVGIRSTFYRISSVFGQGVLVAIAGWLEKKGDIPAAWMWTMIITAVIFGIVTLYHTFSIPRSKNDKPNIQYDENGNAKGIWSDFARSFVTFFKKPLVWLGIAFMLLYRLPEAFLIKMIMPFLKDARVETFADGVIKGGGLELPTETIGLAYGTIGVVALLAGGILGGIYASKVGLKKSLWPMAACMILPCLTFCYLAIFQPTNIIAIIIAIAIEQFGYGFGFTAYMLFMMYLSEGDFKTSHYALCTAFMAASMMIPGFFAGDLQMAVGYKAFFWIVVACGIATMVVTFLAKRRVDANYGKK